MLFVTSWVVHSSHLPQTYGDQCAHIFKCCSVNVISFLNKQQSKKVIEIFALVEHREIKTPLLCGNFAKILYSVQINISFFKVVKTELFSINRCCCPSTKQAAYLGNAVLECQWGSFHQTVLRLRLIHVLGKYLKESVRNHGAVVKIFSFRRSYKKASL